MDNKTYRYKAFISYRHLPLDKKVAIKLQKLLESYRLPKDLRGDQRQWRIFRDESELPSSNNLSENIQEALEQSEFLIVICSETTKQSRWCIEEITSFKKRHEGTTENIITVLIDGNPSEAFPEELCTTVKWVNMPDGSVVQKSETVEPLAANIVSGSMSRTLRKLKSEFLRIAAPLAGCGYDDLYQRHQRRRIQRILAASLSGLSIVSGVAVVMVVLFLKISDQNQQLELSSQEITSKKEQLQESLIDSANQAALLLLERGNREEAVNAILDSYDYVNDPEKLSGETESILVDALYAYETSLDMKQDRVLTAKGAILGCEYNDDCSRILAYDENGYIYEWDTNTGEDFMAEYVQDGDGLMSAFYHGGYIILLPTNSTYEIRTGDGSLYEKQFSIYAFARDKNSGDILLEGSDGEDLLLGISNGENLLQEELMSFLEYRLKDIQSGIICLEEETDSPVYEFRKEDFSEKYHAIDPNFHYFTIDDRSVDFCDGKCAVALTCTLHNCGFVLFLNTEDYGFRLVRLPEMENLETAESICFIDSDKVAVRFGSKDNMHFVCVTDSAGTNYGMCSFEERGQSVLKDCIVKPYIGSDKAFLAMGIGSSYLQIDLDSFEFSEYIPSHDKVCNLEYLEHDYPGLFVFYENGEVYRGTEEILSYYQTIGSDVRDIFIRGDDDHYAACGENPCEITLYSRRTDPDYRTVTPDAETDFAFSDYQLNLDGTFTRSNIADFDGAILDFQYSADGSKYMYSHVLKDSVIGYYVYDALSNEQIGKFEFEPGFGSEYWGIYQYDAVLWEHYLVKSDFFDVSFYDLASGEIEKTERQLSHSNTVYVDSDVYNKLFVTKDGETLLILATDQIKKITAEETIMAWQYEEAVHKRIDIVSPAYLSDDGKWMAVQVIDTENEYNELGLINLEDGSLRLLESLTSQYAGATFSPDNEKMAYWMGGSIHVRSLPGLEEIDDTWLQYGKVQQLVFTSNSKDLIAYTTDGYLHKGTYLEYPTRLYFWSEHLKLDDSLRALGTELTMDVENQMLLVISGNNRYLRGCNGAVFVDPDTMQCRISLLNQIYLGYWPGTKEIRLADSENNIYAYCLYGPEELVDKAYKLINHGKQ